MYGEYFLYMLVMFMKYVLQPGAPSSLIKFVFGSEVSHAIECLGTDSHVSRRSSTLFQVSCPCQRVDMSSCLNGGSLRSNLCIRLVAEQHSNRCLLRACGRVTRCGSGALTATRIHPIRLSNASIVFPMHWFLRHTSSMHPVCVASTRLITWLCPTEQSRISRIGDRRRRVTSAASLCLTHLGFLHQFSSTSKHRMVNLQCNEVRVL